MTDNWSLALPPLDEYLADMTVAPLARKTENMEIPTMHVVNAAWQIPNDAELLANVAKGANMVAGVELRTKEGKPVSLQKILKGWDVAQSLHNDSESGSGFAVRPNSGIHIASTRLVKLSDSNESVQTRYMRTTTVISKRPATVYGTFHLGTKSSGKHEVGLARLTRWCKYVDALPHRRWMIQGDGNESAASIASYMRTQGVEVGGYAGVGVMICLWSRDWRKVNVTPMKFGRTDHAVLNVKED